VLLFLAYLRESRTVPANSDGAGNALQAWDMLHGNVLLHGWFTTDVSFYTTELPQYMLVELARGLGSDVVHVAAAMTYALLVLLAALLARGRATGREAAARMLLAGGIMLAPTLGIGTLTLLLSPDHTGTMVPLLVMWLILDRAGRRWYVPVITGLILALSTVADTVTLLEGTLPVIAVCLLRFVRDRHTGKSPRFELALAGSAAAASAGAAWLAIRLIRRAGGFIVQPVPTSLAPVGALGQHAVNTAKGLLVLFGSDFFGDRSPPYAGYFGNHPGPGAVVATVHLAGIALAAWALCIALRHCYRGTEPVITGLAVAVVLLIAAYLVTVRSSNFIGLREMAGALPMLAVLAGRLLPARLTALRHARPGLRRGAAAGLTIAMVAVGAGYVASLAYNATRRPVPAPYQQVAGWLVAHHLSYGLGGYWQSDSITLETAGRVRVRAVQLAGGGATAGRWEARQQWYDPRLNDADFVVVSPGEDKLPPAALAAVFGPPARAYRVAGSLILTWHKNLLTKVTVPRS
jgi:hypothetical protein